MDELKQKLKPILALNPRLRGRFFKKHNLDNLGLSVKIYHCSCYPYLNLGVGVVISFLDKDNICMLAYITKKTVPNLKENKLLIKNSFVPILVTWFKKFAHKSTKKYN